MCYATLFSLNEMLKDIQSCIILSQKKEVAIFTVCNTIDTKVLIN